MKSTIPQFLPTLSKSINYDEETDYRHSEFLLYMYTGPLNISNVRYFVFYI